MQSMTKPFKIRVKSTWNPFKAHPKCMTKSFQKWLYEKSSNAHSKLIPDAKSEAPGWKSELGERGVEKWVEIWWFLGTLLAIILRPKH